MGLWQLAKKMKKFLIFCWEVIKIVILALLIVVPIRYFLFQPFLVKGQSMESAFQNGDYLIIDQISYRFREPQRGEVIVFKFPVHLSQRFIKRIIGLPGEDVEIKNGKVTIYKDGEGWTLDESSYLPEFLKTPGSLRTSLEEDEYFVLGDNRTVSSDSRKWGVLPEEDIIGRVFFRLWPLSAFAKIKTPAY